MYRLKHFAESDRQTDRHTYTINVTDIKLPIRIIDFRSMLCVRALLPDEHTDDRMD